MAGCAPGCTCRAKLRMTLPTCPVCLGTRSLFFISDNGYELFSCSDCGTVYVYPLPSTDDARALYSDIYHNATTSYFAKIHKMMRRSRHRVRLLQRYVGGGRFLDVGCSGGFMVEAAREAGFAAAGIDLDRPSIDYARRHYPANEFHCGTVEDLAATAPDPFDVVYTSEVIEHVPQVRSFCEHISKLLRPGGVLYITTPDITHWRRPRDVRRWDGFGPPAHLIYFNPKALTDLLAEFGLILVRRRVAWKPGIKLICRKTGATAG
jgi:2-polyprenyl-3-methyl-5-hydroxy-6-metoxy-1,4-benzoquinol methylase